MIGDRFATIPPTAANSTIRAALGRTRWKTSAGARELKPVARRYDLPQLCEKVGCKRGLLREGRAWSTLRPAIFMNEKRLPSARKLTLALTGGAAQGARMTDDTQDLNEQDLGRRPSRINDPRIRHRGVAQPNGSARLVSPSSDLEDRAPAAGHLRCDGLRRDDRWRRPLARSARSIPRPKRVASVLAGTVAFLNWLGYFAGSTIDAAGRAGVSQSNASSTNCSMMPAIRVSRSNRRSCRTTSAISAAASAPSPSCRAATGAVVQQRR